MNGTAVQRAAFWVSGWPDEARVLDAVLAICARHGFDEIETAAPSGWTRTKVEIGRLRASYRATKGTAAGFAAGSGGFELRLQPSLGMAMRWQVVGTIGSRVAADVSSVLETLGAAFGAWTGAGGSTQAFRRSELLLPALPIGAAEARGAWVWSEPIDEGRTKSWMTAIARLIHGVEDGDPGSSAVAEHAQRSPRSATQDHACHAADESTAAAPPASPRSGTEPAAPPANGAAPAHTPSALRNEAVVSSPSPGTAPLDLAKMRAALVAGAVPFAGATSPERLAALRGPAAPSTVETDHTVAADADTDSTMFMPTDASRAIATEAADFARDLRAVPIPELSIDHYAALAVEIEMKGASPEVLRRHGVPSGASLEALRAEQARRMAADPALQQRFEERRAHFLSFAKRPPG